MTLAQALISRTRQNGAILTLDGDEVRLRPGPDGVPRSTVEHLRANRDEVRSLLVTERFGPLTAGGKMCRRCLTINLCRVLRAGFICDGCRRDDDAPYPEALALVEAGGSVALTAANAMLCRENG